MCSVLSPGHRSGKPDERPDPSPAGSDPGAWDQWPLAQRQAFQLACPLAKQPDAWRPTERFQATPGRKHPLEGMLHYILLSKERITGVKTNTHNISVSKKKKNPTTTGNLLRHWNTNGVFLDETTTPPMLGQHGFTCNRGSSASLFETSMWVFQILPTAGQTECCV